MRSFLHPKSSPRRPRSALAMAQALALIALIPASPMAVMLLGTAQPALAQSAFSPRVLVNGQAVTQHEFAQRQRFLTLLNAPPEMIARVEQDLIDDRLRQAEAKRIGLTANAEAVRAGMEEFAGRANLSAEQFTTELGKAGVDAETFRDFVANGILWRDLVRARFQGRLNVTEGDINRALGTLDPAQVSPAGPRIMISEILIRRSPEEDGRAKLLAERVAKLAQSEASFATAARQYSASPSRGRGGKLDWMSLNSLPESVRGRVGQLAPGQSSGPVQVAPGTWALFWLHERKAEAPRLPGEATAVEILRLALADGDQAARLARAGGGCAALYAAARDLPADALVQETRPEAGLPEPLRAQVARLDPGEMALLARAGGGQELVALCQRMRTLDPATMPRDQIHASISNQRLVQAADAFLAELRARAVIRHP